jgi:hypothetical protein
MHSGASLFTGVCVCGLSVEPKKVHSEIIFEQRLQLLAVRWNAQSSNLSRSQMNEAVQAAQQQVTEARGVLWNTRYGLWIHFARDQDLLVGRFSSITRTGQNVRKIASGGIGFGFQPHIATFFAKPFSDLVAISTNPGIIFWG